MTRNEFAAIFIGIVVGLALANILASVHKLLEAGRRVRWDWLAPAMAANAALLTLGVFWHQWVQSQITPHHARHFIAWLPIGAGFFLLYLACAATLPDEVPETGIELRQYYFDSRRRIWGLFGTTFALYLSTWVVSSVQIGLALTLQLNAIYILMNVVGLTLSLITLTVRAVWWHRIAVAALAVLLLAVYGPMLLP